VLKIISLLREDCYKEVHFLDLEIGSKVIQYLFTDSTKQQLGEITTLEFTNTRMRREIDVNILKHFKYFPSLKTLKLINSSCLIIKKGYITKLNKANDPKPSFSSISLTDLEVLDLTDSISDHFAGNIFEEMKKCRISEIIMTSRGLNLLIPQHRKLLAEMKTLQLLTIKRLKGNKTDLAGVICFAAAALKNGKSRLRSLNIERDSLKKARINLEKVNAAKKDSNLSNCSFFEWILSLYVANKGKNLTRSSFEKNSSKRPIET